MITNANYILRIVVVASILNLLTCCVDDVDHINLPNTQPKMVVNSFISPNDTIKVKLNASIPISYNVPEDNWQYTFPIVSNALVIIKNTRSEDEMIIPFNEKLGEYVLLPDGFNIEAGEEYSLLISSPDYDDVSATTRIPDAKPNIVSLSAVLKGENQWGEYSVLVSGTVLDPPNQRNFYTALFTVFSQGDWSDDPYLSFYTRSFFTDADRDGQEISFRMDCYLYDLNSSLVVYVLSTDEHYYRYHRSLENIYNYDGNPFAESSHLYSNIEGGMGVFASYQITEREVILN